MPFPPLPPFSAWVSRFWGAIKEIPNETLDPQVGRSVLFGIGVLAVCASTLGQPLLRFADSGTLAIVGLLAGLFALAFNAIYIVPASRRLHFLALAVISLVAGGLTLAAMSSPMVDAAAANDRRCHTLQSDMLSAFPRKANAPEIFSALKCDPAGVDDTVHVPATAAQVRARLRAAAGARTPMSKPLPIAAQ